MIAQKINRNTEEVETDAMSFKQLTNDLKNQQIIVTMEPNTGILSQIQSQVPEIGNTGYAKSC